jgi:hypothetical protein
MILRNTGQIDLVMRRPPLRGRLPLRKGVRMVLAHKSPLTFHSATYTFLSSVQPSIAARPKSPAKAALLVTAEGRFDVDAAVRVDAQDAAYARSVNNRWRGKKPNSYQFS